ncbi:MAG: sialate O-acetylesterase [Lentisphaeria bacterium]|nr:sialate O-acetylesterase [Lentisphaeria bacterium]
MRLGSLFQDGAVLQHGRVIPVWGQARPGVMIEGELGTDRVFCRTSRTGDFCLYFPAHSPGGPLELRVSVPETGDAVTVRDVLIGEVWLASGQSNMEYPLNADWRTDLSESDPAARVQERAFNAELRAQEDFRYFTVERRAQGAPESTAAGMWRRMTPENSGACSAVAAWFGLYLRRKLDIPVGVIVSAWGGTVAEAWTSLSGLASDPATAELAALARASQRTRECYATEEGRELDYTLCASVQPDSGNIGVTRNWAEPGFDDSDWGELLVPGSWIKQRFAGNGAVWIRRRVELPADWVGRDLVVRTGGIDKHDIGYFNGAEIGRTGAGLDTSCWNLPRAYPVPGRLVTSRTAVVAFRGFSFCQDGSFMGQWKLVRAADGAEIDLNGVWRAAAEYDRGVVNFRKDNTFFGAGNPNTPGILFDGMIRPLLPYALRGVIWYQGESNAAFPDEYYAIMKRLIADWRYHFMNPDLAWVQVQLAGYGMRRGFDAAAQWPVIREAQRRLAAEDAGTFMASAVDCGEELDIHPQDKQSVGWRLAQSALHHVYGNTGTVPSGPEIRGAELLADGGVRLRFDWSDGLTLREDFAPALHLSADGRDFVPADSAEVDGDAVILRSAALSKVAEVRYAWADFPPSTLYNRAGMPAPSFRVEVEK